MISNELQLGKAGEHIVCSDLILQGYNAFMADQGLPYDVLVDVNGSIQKIQVKSTLKLVKPFKRQPHVYRFQMRRGRTRYTKRTPISPDVDCYAFVVLNDKKVAYLPTKQIVGKNGMILQTIDFRNRDIQYVRSKMGRYFDLFSIYHPNV